MVAELRTDKAAGRRDSAGRNLVEGLFPAGGFTEIGRLIGVLPAQEPADEAQGQGGSHRVPGEVVAGWGKRGDQIVFAVADEALEPVPRNPAGAAVAWNVTAEAMRCGAPLVSFPAATRHRDDLRPAEPFMRTGVQLDLAQEQAAAATIPKIIALAGTVDLPVALEMSMAHYVIAGPGSQLVLPDGAVVATSQLGSLGWVDAICTTDAGVLSMVNAVLRLLAGADGPLAEPSGPDPDRGQAASGLEALVFDPASACAFSGLAGGSLQAGLGLVAGHPAGAACGAVRDSADEVRLAKLRRACAVFGLPLIVMPDARQQGRLDIPASTLTGLTSVLLAAGPADDPIPAADAGAFDVVLRLDGSAQASQLAVRELIGRVLADLAVGRGRVTPSSVN